MKTRKLLAVATAPVAAIAATGVAFAFWTVASSGASGTAAAAVLAPPETVGTSGVTATNVTINVTAGPATGPTPNNYRVDRTSPSVVSGVCSISGSTGSCSDPSPVQGATNNYSVFSLVGTHWVAQTAATTSAIVPSSDTTAPTSAAPVLSPAANGSGWNNANVTVTLSATDNSGGSGVKQITYSATGAQPINQTVAAGSSTTVSINVAGTTTISYFATDNANNVESTHSIDIKLDETGPINALTLSGTSGNPSFIRSGNVYYQGHLTGSFTLTNSLTDALSGPASSATAALTGTTTGWTHTPSTVSTPSGGPYVSNAFTWASATSSSPSEAITGKDVADNASTTNMSFIDDETAPTGGSVGYASRTNSNMGQVTFSAGSDAGSGIDVGSANLQRASAALVNGSCGAFGSFSNLPNVTTSPYSDAGRADGCYEYRYVVSDNVGNSATFGGTLVEQVDSTKPADALSLSNVTKSTANGSPLAIFSAGTLTYNSTAAGTVNMADTVTDNGIGPSTATFPGTTATGWTHTSPVQLIGGTGSAPSIKYTDNTGYAWPANPTANQTPLTVTSTDVAGNQSLGSTITFVADSSKPVTADNVPSAWQTGPTTVTLTPTDSGSGVASTYYTTDGSTPAVNTSGTPTGTTQTGTSISLTSDGSYTIKYFSIDKVGNQEAVETAANQVRIDSTKSADSVSIAATGTSSTNGSPLASLSSGTLYYNSSVPGSVKLSDAVTDTGSGPASATFPAVNANNWTGHTTATTVSSGTGTGATKTYTDSATYTWTANPSNPGVQTITSKDVAGNSSAGEQLTFTSDTVAPATTDNAPSGATTSSVTVTLVPSDSGSGVGNTFYTTDGSTPAVTSTGTLSGTTKAGTTVTLSSDGSYTVKYFSIDNVGNQEAVESSNTFTIDTTPPTPTGLATTNKTGNTSGTIEAGDSIALTFSEAMDPTSLLAGWNGSSTSITANGIDGGAGTDTLTFSSGATQLSLGTVDLKYTGFFSANVTYRSSTMILSADKKTVTITLGSVSDATKLGNQNNNNQKSKAVWTPTSGAHDLAGNGATGSFTSGSNSQYF